MKSIQDGICGYVGGGLGNQLFMLAAAWEQSKRLDVPLYIDTSHFGTKNLHGLWIDKLQTPAIFLEKESPWASLKYGNGRALPFPKKFNPLRQTVFLEKNLGRFDPRINQVLPGTTLIGYFQSSKYSLNIKNELTESILNFPVSEAEQIELDRISKDPRVTLHLRRGDYMLDPKSNELLTSFDYVSNCLELLKRQGSGTKVRVFSDSPELIKTELDQLPKLDIELVEDKDLLGPVATLRAMASGTEFIMSNSTFSWWAAWLMNQTQGHNTVIAPRPWSTGNSNRVDLLEKKWLTLDSRA